MYPQGLTDYLHQQAAEAAAHRGVSTGEGGCCPVALAGRTTAPRRCSERFRLLPHHGVCAPGTAPASAFLADRGQSGSVRVPRIVGIYLSRPGDADLDSGLRERDENAAINIEAEGLTVLTHPEDTGGVRAFGGGG